MGSGNYKHKAASVHGIWPASGQYGNSQCIKPQNAADATTVPSCYQNDEAKSDPQHALEFVNHEWDKHGRCAGAKDVTDFFNTVCSLSADPVAAMEKKKEAGATFSDMVSVIKQAGYPIFSVDQ